MSKPPRKPKSPRRPQVPTDLVAKSVPSDDADALWMSLRQGARNVAGVSWQIAVTAHLLIAAHAGERDFTRIVPEGFEDIDCLTSGGLRILVQVKEKGAGAGTMTAVDVADVLVHAAKAGKYVNVRSIVLVTDGDLGSGLSFTGWDSTLSELPSTSWGGLIELLKSRDLDPGLANQLAAQTHLVRLPWNLRDSSELLLRTSSGMHPSVATLVVSELYARLPAATAEQRSRPRDNAVATAPGDIDTLIEQIQSTVDVAGLDAAVAAGVCGSADFTTDPGVRPDQFYLGVDGAPGHIAAGLDVLRPHEMTLIVEAAQNQRYALVVGPSGCGKSVLLWRAARDAVLGSRIVRVRRVKSDEDVLLLRRHVQLTRPTMESPVIVVADNLGRPHMEHWPDAVSALRELPGVVLFGACRAEDFHPRLARGVAQIVRPALDEYTAQRIARRLEEAGLSPAMASTEAFQRCDGLLMEYLALLLKGQRLQLILSEQAAGLRDPGRELQRRAARLIAGAHSLGFSLSVEAIKSAFAPSVSPEELGDALQVLQGEHLIVLDGDTWRGLHELRSRTLAEQLHDAPPPSFGETLAKVARAVTIREASWLLRRTAERYPRWAPYVAGALAEHLRATPNLDAATLAELLEGAERADNLIYARACLPAFTDVLPEGWSIATAATVAYGIKCQGRLAEARDATSRALRLAFSPLVRAMPERSEQVLTELSLALNSARIVEMADNASLMDAVRLLEALAGSAPLEEAQVERIHRHFPVPSNRADAAYWARLTEALFHLLPRNTATAALGSIEDRANVIAKAEPWAFAIAMEGIVPHASVLQAAEDEAIRESLPWEADERPNTDTLEAIAKALASRIAFACPDAPAVGVRTYSPSGRPFMVDGYEPAQCLIPSSVRTERIQDRRKVGFGAALRRLAAAETWTELLTAEARLGAELVALAAEAPRRLKTTDNARRRNEWTARVEAAQKQADVLKPEPPSRDHGVPASHAKADARERQSDPTATALAGATSALNSIVSNAPRPALEKILRDAAERLGKAREISAPALSGIGEPIPELLIEHFKRLSALAAASLRDPAEFMRLQLGDEHAMQVFLEESARKVVDRQTEILDAAFDDVPERRIQVLHFPEETLYGTGELAFLVTMPLSAWHTALTAAERLDDSFRRQLEANTIVAPRVGDQVSVGGIWVSRFGPRPYLPAPPDYARTYAAAAGLPTAEAGADQPAMVILDKLVRLSWMSVLHRRRAEQWGAATPSARDELQAVRHSITGGNWHPTEESVLTTLLNQVEQEMESAEAAEATLAGTLADIQTAKLDDPDSDEARLLQMLGALWPDALGGEN